METATLYVLDFNTSETHIYTIKAGQQIEDVEEFISEQGHNVSDCQFMYGDIEVKDHRAPRTIAIEVSGGCVTDVHGLPDGWSYDIADWDEQGDYFEEQNERIIREAKAQK